MNSSELLEDDRIITGAELLEREKANGELPPALDILWRFLSKHCRGRGNAMLAADIGVRLGHLVKGADGRRVGDGKTIVHMVSDLVNDHLKAVASITSGHHRGLFVAVTRQEKDVESQSIDSRIIALARRKRAFNKAPIEKQPPVQKEMFG